MMVKTPSGLQYYAVEILISLHHDARSAVLLTRQRHLPMLSLSRQEHAK